jgi:hypothetical protein
MLPQPLNRNGADGVSGLREAWSFKLAGTAAAGVSGIGCWSREPGSSW